LASTTDTCALVLVFPGDDGSSYDVLPYFWCPEDMAETRSKRNKVLYGGWIRAGEIKATSGNITDYDVIRADIRALGEKYDIREIAVDRWNATQIITQLDADGFTVVPFGQGVASMSAPSKELERLLLGRKIRHGGHSVLTWHASNVSVKTDAQGNIKPDRARSSERGAHHGAGSGDGRPAQVHQPL
jgi:phage terminase large subunit-like protein